MLAALLAIIGIAVLVRLALTPIGGVLIILVIIGAFS